jgi:hypothetical protein
VKAETAASPAAAAPAGSNALQQLKDDLQQVNRDISRIARDSRGGPDGGRHSQLPEKQELLARRQELERKIRTLSTK